MPDGWCDFAIRCDGPLNKVGYNWGTTDRTHSKVGVTIHCAEYESTPEWDDYKTLHNALFSEREASWTFSICEFMGGALLFQHYPIGTVCWAQGYLGNLWLDSIETERIAPHKLTDPQYALLVKTLRWIKDQHKEEHAWERWRGIGTKVACLGQDWAGWLFEHNAVPGAPATDCQVFTRCQIDPQRLLRDLEDEDMDEQQIREIVRDEVAKQTNWMRGFCQALSNVIRPLGFWPFSEEEKNNKAREDLEIDAWENLNDSEMKFRGY